MTPLTVIVEKSGANLIFWIMITAAGFFLSTGVVLISLLLTNEDTPPWVLRGLGGQLSVIHIGIGTVLIFAAFVFRRRY